MGVSFEFFLSVGSEVCHFLGSFNLVDAVVLVGGFFGIHPLLCGLVVGFLCVVLLKTIFPTLGNEWGVSCVI